MSTLRLLSCGAGVQTAALALMACRGELDERFGRLDGAIFADTGWEPERVYEVLNRLEVEFRSARIPLHRVSNGHLRRDTLDPESRFVSIPYFTLAPEGTTVRDEIVETDDEGREIIVGYSEPRPATRKEREGIGRRQCTSEYKLKPIGRAVRMLLGAPGPDYRRVPRGRVAEQWIGFSADEIHRVNDRQENRYTRKRYPLIELGMTRKDCVRYLRSIGWSEVGKSSCIGCPYHGNAQWRDMRDHDPEAWADAVAFDQRIRKGGTRTGRPALDGEAFLHRSRVPLDQAPIDRVTPREWADRQIDIFDELAEQGDPDGCSPYGCRSGLPLEAA
ncbi:hypothetical protein [Nocardia carnea]|uniref:hypothetical protein n=1 Tax=Nocardia carnea TaxID=37328 RepID=UPI0024564EDD|nr:hypothetical protein [Nocardia carnea]